MKRSIASIENEVVHQILICELCFEICNSINIALGRGNDFLPYYYNLNFTKGLLSLHSLLLSSEKDELSVKNYIKDYKKNYPKADTQDFEKEIASISNSFRETSLVPLRHKIAARIAESFSHTDFTSAYIMPKLVSKYVEIISHLKNIFFEFCNYAKNDQPFRKIKEQSDAILRAIK